MLINFLTTLGFIASVCAVQVVDLGKIPNEGLSGQYTPSNTDVSTFAADACRRPREQSISKRDKDCIVNQLHNIYQSNKWINGKYLCGATGNYFWIKSEGSNWHSPSDCHNSCINCLLGGAEQQDESRYCGDVETLATCQFQYWFQP